MIFNKKDEGRKNDDMQRIREIKEAMRQRDEAQHEMIHKEDYDGQNVRKMEEKATHDSDAPLFVKLDKYKDAVSEMKGVKAYLSGVRHVIAVLNEIEVVRNETLKMLRETASNLEQSINELDARLLRPKGVDLGDLKHGEEEIRNVEDSLAELQDQLATLSHEIQGFRG